MPLRPKGPIPRFRNRRPLRPGMDRMFQEPLTGVPEVDQSTRFDISMAEVVQPLPDDVRILETANVLALANLQLQPLNILRSADPTLAVISQGPTPYSYSAYYDIEAEFLTNAMILAVNSLELRDAMRRVITDAINQSIAIHAHDPQDPDE